MTAIISIFLSQRIVWKQEDEYEPDVTILFDLDSRSKIIQLVIKNIGGSSAYDIKINWLLPMNDFRNDEIKLPYIPTLAKNECIRYFIGISTETFQNAKKENIELIYKGEILYKYKKNSKKYIRNHFEISLEHFRNKLRPITDEQAFYLENTHLNENLKRLVNSLERIEKLIEQKNENLFENSDKTNA
ncbi:MAG: hypothetical protein HXX16_10280 [Bacteroidales bacterium]|nr:hypothetical protein [Bacteroidales bacterium]